MYKTYIFQAKKLKYSRVTDSITKDSDAYYYYPDSQQYEYIGLYINDRPMNIVYLDNYIYGQYKKHGFFGREVFLIVNAKPDDREMRIVYWDAKRHEYHDESINEREFDELTFDEWKAVEKQLVKFVHENEKDFTPTSKLEKELLS